MGRYDKFVSFFWLSLGLVVIYGGYKIGLGRLNNPGGGLFIFILGVCLFLLALIIFVGSCSKKMKDTPSVVTLSVNWKWENPFYILLALIIYTFAIAKLGYCLSTIFLLIFLFNVIERQKWKTVMFEALLTVFLSFLFFGIFLEVRFPRGPFEILIGR